MAETPEPDRIASSVTEASWDTTAKVKTPADLESASSSCHSFYVPTPNFTPEPFRDISFLGPITIHRLLLFTFVAGVGIGLYYLQLLIWPFDPNPEVWYSSPALGIIWLLPLPSALLYLVGALMFRVNTKLDRVKPIDYNLVFRIVSRGINVECLMDTIHSCREEMARNPLFPYLIEVVTDADMFEAPDYADVIHLKVPISYQTPNNTMFKARALNYACENSTVPPNTWVIHLDEETRPTSSGIKGIAQFVRECEEKQDLKRIGQGSLLYHRSFEEHPFLTLADMRRTGDDYGHFYLQHRIGLTLFGLHGSFLVCRHDMEAAIAFDMGPRGSITEDSWWVLLAMHRGYRTKWIDGFLEEQSTQSVMDFLKQRRRWYFGLIKVITYCPVPLQYRLVLGYHVVTWVLAPMVMPVQLAYGIFLFIENISVHPAIRVLSIICFEVMFLVYLTGLIANMHEHKMKWWKRILYTIAMVLVVPVCTLMEIAAVVLAFFAPLSKTGRGFHVVQKSGKVHDKPDMSAKSIDSFEGDKTNEPQTNAAVVEEEVYV